MPLVRAHLRHLHIAPRKVRLVIDLVRGMSVERALEQLSVLPKRSALPVLKLIKSAAANAKNNNQLDEKTLVIHSIIANEGPRLKRWQPRAFGRANPILKRTTHITVVLDGKETKAPKPVVKKEAPTKVDITDLKQAPAKAPSTTKKPLKPDTTSNRAKERSGRDVNIPRKGTD